MAKGNIHSVDTDTQTSINITNCFSGGEITATIVNIIEQRLVVVNVSSTAKLPYQVKWWNLPSRRSGMITREHITQRAMISLQPSLSIPQEAIRQIVFYGLAGTGKTTIALEVTYQYLEQYHQVFWFDAKSEEALKADFIMLAHALGLTYSSPEEAILILKGWIADNPRSLLVFDGVKEYEAVANYLPRLNADIVITSQANEWPDHDHAIEVPEFTGDEAYALVQSALGKSILPKQNESSVVNLLVYFGNHPLGLGQALAYMEDNVIGIDEYLHLVRKYPLHVLSGGIRQSLPLYYHGLPVIHLWDDIVSSSLGQESVTGKLLKLLCWLSDDNVPLSLLAKLTKESDPVVLHETIGRLAGWSLIKKDIAANTVFINPFLQKVLLLKQHPEEKAEIVNNLSQFFLSQPIELADSNSG